MAFSLEWDVYSRRSQNSLKTTGNTLVASGRAIWRRKRTHNRLCPWIQEIVTAIKLTNRGFSDKSATNSKTDIGFSLHSTAIQNSDGRDPPPLPLVEKRNAIDDLFVVFVADLGIGKEIASGKAKLTQHREAVLLAHPVRIRKLRQITP